MAYIDSSEGREEAEEVLNESPRCMDGLSDVAVLIKGEPIIYHPQPSPFELLDVKKDANYDFSGYRKWNHSVLPFSDGQELFSAWST